ncbi:short chain dehydrogenase [compost metagenome]
MTSALIEHLKTREGAVVANVSSVLGFVPLAITAVYSATKAALHSYTLSQRFLLRDSGVSVIEIAPPWVRTELLNSSEEERAMPLETFIAGAIEQLGTDANEILVGPAVDMRANPGPNEHAWVNEFNDSMVAG